jgi:hypothetical protein
VFQCDNPLSVLICCYELPHLLLVWQNESILCIQWEQSLRAVVIIRVIPKTRAPEPEDQTLVGKSGSEREREDLKALPDYLHLYVG